MAHVQRSVKVNLLNKSQEWRENLEWFLFMHYSERERARKLSVNKIFAKRANFLIVSLVLSFFNSRPRLLSRLL